MDVWLGLIDEYADRFYNLPTVPLLYCGHFMIVTLGLRKKIGVTFAQTNPLACWLSTVVANLSGVVLINALLGRPIILMFEDPNKILVITIIWYLAFFCPNNLFTKFFTSKPLWVIIILLKEAQRAKGMVEGVRMGMKLYPDAMLIVVIIGFLKGAAGVLADPVAASIRGSLSLANNEAVKPSFITKISIFISIALTLSQKGVTNIPESHLCLAAFLVLALVKVSLFLSGWRDPFIRFEDAVSPICFGSPVSNTETSSRSKKTKKE
ncbi:hypothetical protein QZH41_014613 [Actinostola sp. cb2023]|nr:hypothetical protein QZH41_014613 [Actinostola sp. cb2023]